MVPCIPAISLLYDLTRSLGNSGNFAILQHWKCETQCCHWYYTANFRTFFLTVMVFKVMFSNKFWIPVLKSYFLCLVYRWASFWSFSVPFFEALVWQELVSMSRSSDSTAIMFYQFLSWFLSASTFPTQRTDISYMCSHWLFLLSLYLIGLPAFQSYLGLR